MAQFHAENVYSFRVVQPVLGTLFPPQSPEQVALAAIEAKLVEANTAYLDRRYQDAIAAYTYAQALIYAQLDPGFPFDVTVPLSRDAALFAPLLSASLEYLNLLPVQEAISPVRPRVSVDPASLGEAANLEGVGLLSSQVADRASQDAMSKWKLSKSFLEMGNDKAASFFMDQAKAADASVVSDLDSAAGGGPAPAGGGAGGGAGAGATTGGGAGTVVFNPVVFHPLTGLPLKFHVGSDAAMMASTLELPPAMTVDRTFGTLVDGQVVRFAWQAGQAPPLDQVTTSVYEARRTTTSLPDILQKPSQPADVALGIPHDYYYTVPLGLAECHHALGDYTKAEGLYLEAASYQYLNAEIEAPYIWQRLAALYVDWGDSLFRQDDPEDARALYERVITKNDGEPAGDLYSVEALKPGADVARAVFAAIAAHDDLTALTVNPFIVALVVEARQQLIKIEGGLDFWGFWAPTVPIWTFDYLQRAAVNFAQLAISAERDVITFWDRADQAALTRQQISQAADQANAEVEAAQLQADAARAEATAFQVGAALAQQRATDAQQNANQYASMSAIAIQYQALAAQTGGGDDGEPGQLNALADTLQAGSSIEGSYATLSATNQLVASRLNRDYEVDSMRRQASEMAVAGTQAKAELNAANARVAAADAGAAVAVLRAHGAQQMLAAFDAQTFTPDVWYAMGQQMWKLYQRYFAMAQHVARLMQRAYNFETDQSLHLIKTDYSTDTVNGLLGADSLMADIHGFSYELITSSRSKPQAIKQTISLAERYGFAFETQLRATGVMEFETRVDDFDAVYPGTYAGRLEAVEVEVDGIVPPTGVSGTLTNGGISAYRLPAAAWTDLSTSGLKYRVQPEETLVLSDLSARQDALLIPKDERIMQVFQGAGPASTWRLELPKGINNFDYGALTDVRLTFYYRARYDPELRETVLTQLSSRPGFTARQVGIPLRWVYPDAFFRFQRTGELAITLRPSDLPKNQRRPVLSDIGVLVITDGSIPAKGTTLGLATPTHAAVDGTTDAAGAIASTSGPWKPLARGTVLGDYVISVDGAANPSLVHDGTLTLAPIVNVSLILGYSFTPRT